MEYNINNISAANTSSEYSEECAPRRNYKLRLSSRQNDIAGFSLFDALQDESLSDFDFNEGSDEEDSPEDDDFTTELSVEDISVTMKNFGVPWDTLTPEESITEFVTEAELSYTDGRITCSYDESELSGTPGCSTVISFRLDDPSVVTVMRSGVVRSVLILEEGRRHVCSYITQFMTFEVCAYTRQLENSLSVDGGKLTIDYAIEIKGAAAQRTRMVIEIEKM